MLMIIGIVLGAIAGMALLDESGALLGAVLGWLVVTQLKVSSRLKRLEPRAAPSAS